MAANLSDYLENKLYDHCLRATAYTAPASLWIALSTANPTETGGGLTPPVGGAYARLNVGGATGRSFTAPALGVGANAQHWEFAEATGSWGTITHWALMDAASAGNMLIYAPLTASVAVTAGKIFRFPAGELSITWQGDVSDYLANKLYDHVLRATAFTSPASLWLALSTAATTDAGAHTPPVGGAYARLEVVGVTGRSFTAPGDGAGDNGQHWEFAEATGSWGTLSHMAIMDALSAGNMLMHRALTASVAVTAGEVLRFPAGALDVAFT